MDFLNIIRSIEELLYEVMAWLVFYPRTMWRAIRHPYEMMRYSEVEQTEAPEKQYTDTLSPPLFLLLSVLISHGIEAAAREHAFLLHGGLGAEIVKSHESLLALRAITFSVFPIMFALAALRHLGRTIDRDRLRAPFFSQCYVAAPFALGLGLASVAIRWPLDALRHAGVAAVIAIIIWYLWLQTRWLAAHLGISIARSLALAVWTFAKAVAIIAVGAVALR